MEAVAKLRREPGAIELIEVPDPAAGPGEVLVAVERAGLCGSDAGIYGWESAFERMQLPTIIGHEYTGRIVAIGEEVSGFSVGDRIIERPIRYCDSCYQCRRGMENVCQEARITGVDHDGGFAPVIAVPERSVLPVPDDLAPRHAALVEPTSVAARVVCHNSAIRPGDSVLVEGPGPIGLLCALIARIQGAQVVVSGTEQDATYRLPVANELGLKTVLADANVADALPTENHGGGFDVVIDATGHPSGLTTAASVIRPGGQVVVVGQTGETTMAYSPLVRKEVDIQCSYTSTIDDFDRAFSLLTASSLDVEPMIDDSYDLTEPIAAFEAFVSGETIKPVFDVSALAD